MQQLLAMVLENGSFLEEISLGRGATGETGQLGVGNMMVIIMISYEEKQ